MATPDALLIYYGYPSLINRSRTREEAARHFSGYARVVLGDGLQSPIHPDHDATRAIVQAASEVQFYGYIDLGVAAQHQALQNLPLAEIEKRADAWKQLGVCGILLDDFGYDFGVSRERQRQAVQALHARDLRVVANSWDPRHALDDSPGPANPAGQASSLRPGDAYLFESYLISNGAWGSFKQWRAKANTLTRLLRRLPVEVWSVTTCSERSPDLGESAWQFIYHCAWLEGHQAVGWGDPYFAAGDNQVAGFAAPEPPGRRRNPPVRAAGHSSVAVDIEAGQLVADYAAKRILVEPARPWWRKLLQRG